MQTTGSADLVEQVLSTARTADGVFAVGPDQRITHWGPTAERILGRQAAAVLHHTCQDVIGGRDARNAQFCRRNCPIIRNASKGRPTPNYDILVRCEDGTPKWINVTLLVFHDPDQPGMSVVHLFRDVTKRRQLEEKARRAMLSLRQTRRAPKQTAGREDAATPAPLPEGAARLTRRERETLRLLAMGLSTPQIAESMGVSPITARNHITNLQTKLGAKTRLQAVLYASEQQIV